MAGLGAAGVSLLGLKWNRETQAAASPIQTVVITVLSDSFLPPRVQGSGLCLHVGVIAQDGSGHNFMFECAAGGQELQTGIARTGVRLSNVQAFVMGGWRGARTAGYLETLAGLPGGGLGARMFWPNACGSSLETEACQIVPGAYLTPIIPTPQPVLDTGEPARNGERAVYINLQDKGLVVISGCSRAGMPAAVRAAMACSGVSKVHAAVGGFHLDQADAGCIGDTISELKALSPSYLVPMHCTGEGAVAQFRRSMPECFPIHPMTGYSVERRIMFT